MISENFQGDKGAPLRVFLLVISFWVFGRLLWTAWLAVDIQSASLIIPDVMAAQLQNNSQPNVVEVKSGQDRSNFSNYQLLVPSVSVRTLPLSHRGYINKNYNQITNSTQIKNAEIANISRQSQSSNVSIKAVDAIKKRSRWTSYFWLHAREDSGRILSDFGKFSQPFYGGSQAGARISYRLSDDNQKYVGLYARASTAIAVSGQEELALGISVQPLETSALTVNVEHRERENGQSSNAAYLVYNPNPKVIAPDTRLETYFATGYVLSTRDQYFADGYASIQKLR